MNVVMNQQEIKINFDKLDQLYGRIKKTEIHLEQLTNKVEKIEENSKNQELLRGTQVISKQTLAPLRIPEKQSLKLIGHNGSYVSNTSQPISMSEIMAAVETKIQESFRENIQRWESVVQQVKKIQKKLEKLSIPDQKTQENEISFSKESPIYRLSGQRLQKFVNRNQMKQNEQFMISTKTSSEPNNNEQQTLKFSGEIVQQKMSPQNKKEECYDDNNWSNKLIKASSQRENCQIENSRRNSIIRLSNYSEISQRNLYHSPLTPVIKKGRTTKILYKRK